MTALQIELLSQMSGTIDTLSVELGIDHTYVNELTLTLSNGATTITLINRPTTSNSQNCQSNNINVSLSDLPASLPAINASCATGSSNEAFTQDTYKPFEPLSGFKDTNVNGTWTLTVTDSSTSDTGTLGGWRLNFTKNRL